MPAAAKRYKIKFEETQLQFSERYPEALSEVLPLAEFDGIIRKINGDMTQEIRAQQKKVHKWSAVCIGLCLLVAGVCLTPVVFVQTRRQRKKTKAFWERLRTYLGEINRKTYLKRNLEWKLVEDKSKIRRRDVVNPLLAYRLELVHRTQKGKTASGDTSRLGSQSVPTMASTTSRAGSVSGGPPSLSRSVTQSARGPNVSQRASQSANQSTTKPVSIISLASFNTEPVAGARPQRTSAAATAAATGKVEKDQVREVARPIKGVGEEGKGNLISSSSQSTTGSHGQSSPLLDSGSTPTAEGGDGQSGEVSHEGDSLSRRSSRVRFSDSPPVDGEGKQS